MSNLFDWSQSLLGVQDPREEMARYADAQRQRNLTALGVDANGNPVAPPDPNAPAAAAVAAGSTLPPNQVPNAVKSDPSMGRMIVDLERYNERKQQFNSSLGGVFATISQPRNREMMSHAFDANLPDPAKFGESIMAVGSQQQGQDRANAVNRLVNDPNTGPQIARAFGMDWGALKVGVLADPGLAARIAETWGTADQKVRAGAQVGHGALGGAAGGPTSDIGKQIISDVGGQPAMEQAQMAWDAKYPGQPTPWNRNDVADFTRYTKDQQDRQDNAREFLQKNHSLGIDKTTEFQHLVEDLKKDPGMVELMNRPNAYRAAIDWIRKNPDEPLSQIANAVPDWVNAYPPEVKAALAKIQQLHSRDYANAMHSIGQRFSTQEVQNVSRGMDRLLNLELGPKDYQDALDQLIEETKTVRANSFGAAQEFDTMDPELRTYVNPTFTKGGRSNVTNSGSEDWADKVKPPQSMIDEAKAALAKGASHTAIERRFREKGFRPMGF